MTLRDYNGDRLVWTSKKIDAFIDDLDDCMEARDFPATERLLNKLHDDDIPLSLKLSCLSITKHHKAKLPARAKLVDHLNAQLAEQPADGMAELPPRLC